MIRLAFTFWILALPVMAQTVPDTPRLMTILSGEHDGFTRLSLQIGTRHWQIGRVEGGYGLRLSPRGVIDTSRIFATIGRDRIDEVTAQSTGLDIALACNCHLRSFRHQGDWLVMDVVDGLPSSDSPYELALPADGGALPIILQQDQPVLPPMLNAPAMPDPAVTAFEASLLQQLAEAVETEAVTPVTTLSSTPAAIEESGTEAELTAVTSASPAINLRYDAFVEGDVLRDALSPTICADDAEFALHDWMGTSFGDQIANAQTALSEAINLAPAARVLAQSYLAYGFGLEAKQVLQAYPGAQEEARFLSALADIVDGKAAHDAFTNQDGCRGAVTFWRVLGIDSALHLGGEELGTLIETFRRLPRDLRMHLAPRLADILTKAGHARLAVEVMDIVVSYDATPQLRSDAAQEPLDMIAAITSKLERVDSVTLDDLHLLQSMRYEWRGSAYEHQVQQAEVRVLSALQQHADAMSTAASLPEGLRIGALSLAVDHFVTTAPTESLISTALAMPDMVDDQSVNKVAKRLIEEGFADLALRFLAPAATGADMAQRRYLRAEAAVQLGLADMVEGELLGLQDERSEALRAAVLSTTPEAPTYAWRRADMAALRRSEDPLLQQAAEAVQGDPAPLPPTPLASREALITQAQEARALANALLARFSAQP